MTTVDLKCQPRRRRNGKWTFTILGNEKWEESASEFSTPEEAIRVGIERVEQIKKTER